MIIVDSPFKISFLSPPTLSSFRLPQRNTGKLNWSLMEIASSLKERKSQAGVTDEPSPLPHCCSYIITDISGKKTKEGCKHSSFCHIKSLLVNDNMWWSSAPIPVPFSCARYYPRQISGTEIPSFVISRTEDWAHTSVCSVKGSRNWPVLPKS